MNRLAEESSLYLRQHASNPVHWYPWGEEAFAAARSEDKPVFLSVGYASCHWCHVMAHESFEDPEVAKVMNDGFINIKVDREERPDVDAIYMEATQAMTGQGGWPMSVFLDADRRPFLAGTYFPRRPVGQMPTFTDVLDAVGRAWVDQRENLAAQAQELQRVIIDRTTTSATNADIANNGSAWVASAREQILSSHDDQWGGFGSAPKFPQTTSLELLMRDGDDQSLAAVVNTLDAMASGGLYDHVGGGFHRYSVDAFWMVPHFEKMLYDQASLVRAYTHAFQITGHERYRQVVEETIGYVRRDLASPTGAFFSSEDADSEGDEGRFYVWRPEQIEAAASDSTIAMSLIDWFGVTSSGNFEGSNILHRPVRGDLLRDVTTEEGRKRLFMAREERERPALDDKVLTEWNAMFIGALCEAGQAMNRPDWVEAGVAAAEHLLSALRTSEGRWLRSWQPSTGARHLAYAQDHAWLIDAFTRLGEATGQARWRQLAIETAQVTVELFWDNEHGGLFTTGSDAERMIVHSKDLFDGATNSANSTAAHALIRLSRLTGDDEWARKAEQIIALVAEPLAAHPTAFTNTAIAIEMLTKGGTETVVAGDHPELINTVKSAYLPDNVLVWGERDNSPLWEGRTEGAYVCRNSTCGPVAHDPETLLQQLES